MLESGNVIFIFEILCPHTFLNFFTKLSQIFSIFLFLNKLDFLGLPLRTEVTLKNTVGYPITRSAELECCRKNV